MSFHQGQAKQQDKRGAHMTTSIYCFVRIPQQILHYVPDNSTSSLILHIYFHFFMILLVSFDVSSHQWGYYKVYQPKRYIQLWLLVCNNWFGLDGFPLLTWGFSANLAHLHWHVFICYGLGFIYIFLLCLQIFALGLAMLGLTFPSSYL